MRVPAIPTSKWRKDFRHRQFRQERCGCSACRPVTLDDPRLVAIVDRWTVLLFGLCKPVLVIDTVAYVLLATAAVFAILYPHNLVSKCVALAAYILLAGLFLFKVCTVGCVKVSLRDSVRKRRQAATEPSLPDNGLAAPDAPA